jgi:transcriptional antiterminator NusG
MVLNAEETSVSHESEKLAEHAPPGEEPRDAADDHAAASNDALPVAQGEEGATPAPGINGTSDDQTQPSARADVAAHVELESAESTDPVAVPSDADETGNNTEVDEEEIDNAEIVEGEINEEEVAEDVDDEEDVPVSSGDAKPIFLATDDDQEDLHMDWYIIKVQSNRERSITDALRRKIAVEGLDRYFGQIIVPTEKVTEFKGGKKRVVERKLWPGYIVVQMHINDETWFAVRETSGIGDFTGAAGKPTPMQPHEVARIVQAEEEETDEAPKLDIKFSEGDRVKVKEGNFENFEGEVNSIDEASGRVTVMINIFGRSTPVELEYWQIEGV